MSLHIGAFEFSILDLLLFAMFYIVISEIAVTKSHIPQFILIPSLMLLSAALISAISFSYIFYKYIYYDIKITLKLFEHAVLIFVATYIIRDIFFIRKVLLTLCLGIFILSVLTVVKSLGFQMPGIVRMTGEQFGPFFIGTVAFSTDAIYPSLLILTVFPLVFYNVVFRFRAIRILLCFFLILTAIISFTRSLWISLAIQIIMFFILSFRKSKEVSKKMITAVLLLMIVTTLSYYAIHISTSLLELRPMTVENRILGYFQAIKMVTSSPLYLLFGIGKGFFVSKSLGSVVPHNFLLDLLISKGLIVMSIVLILICIIIMELFKIIKNSRLDNSFIMETYANQLLIILIGLFIEGLFVPLTNSIVFWTGIAIMCSFISINKMKHQNR
jgi:hypothetical protein